MELFFGRSRPSVSLEGIIQTFLRILKPIARYLGRYKLGEGGRLLRAISKREFGASEDPPFVEIQGNFWCYELFFDPQSCFFGVPGRVTVWLEVTIRTFLRILNRLEGVWVDKSWGALWVDPIVLHPLIFLINWYGRNIHRQLLFDVIWIMSTITNALVASKTTFEGLADKVVTPCKIAWFLTCNPERIFVYIFLVDFWSFIVSTVPELC